jgi:alkane 1-monooxygenase
MTTAPGSVSQSVAGGIEEADALACPGCGYVYEVAVGDEHEGFAAGTSWSAVPESWCCPDCGVREKSDFVALELP